MIVQKWKREYRIHKIEKFKECVRKQETAQKSNFRTKKVFERAFKDLNSEYPFSSEFFSLCSSGLVWVRQKDLAKTHSFLPRPLRKKSWEMSVSHTWVGNACGLAASFNRRRSLLFLLISEKFPRTAAAQVVNGLTSPLEWKKACYW